jgi:hypothetical protein
MEYLGFDYIRLALWSGQIREGACSWEVSKLIIGSPFWAAFTATGIGRGPS